MKALKASQLCHPCSDGTQDVVTLAEFKHQAVTLQESISKSSQPLLITQNGKPAI